MLRQGFKSQQAGLGIIELMVSVLIAAIVLGGVIALTLNISVTSGTNLKTGQLNQALRTNLDYLTRDLARAGFVNWSAAWDNCDPTENTPGVFDDANDDGKIDILDYYQCVTPVLAEFGALSLASFNTPGDADSGIDNPDCTTGCDCILYRYDIDRDGQLSTGDFELFGFRRHDGRLQSRTGGAGVGHSCDTGIWTDVTDPVADITGLSFSLVFADSVAPGNDSTVYPINGGTSGGPSSSCTPGSGGLGEAKCLWRRKINIDMAGRLAADPTVQISLSGEVKIRNDYFQTQAP